MNGEPQHGLPARLAATALLARVLRAGQPFDICFQQACETGDLKALPPRDRAFVRLIAATCLRRLGQIDDALSRFLERPLPKKSGTAREILVSAAAQLMFLETPAHAAIDLAVEAAEADPASQRFKGLVNAVLRRVSEHAPQILRDQNAARLNTPDWLWARWTRAYGEENTRRIALAHLNEPSLDITAKSGPADWASRLNGHLMPSGTIRLTDAGRIQEIDGYGDGAWWVQDAAAALPVKLFGDLGGHRVLELCAAPGGKTAQLAAAGAGVTAVDVSAPRMTLLEENLARLGLTARTVVSAALEFTPEKAPEFILLDAPCSATGTIRRHPDIARSKTEKTVHDLAAVQERMLDHATSLLAPGGMLVYCTCSLEPEEGEHQADRLIARGDMRRLPVEPGEIGGMAEVITAEGDLRTLPCHYSRLEPALSGLDGFFATRLEKL